MSESLKYQAILFDFDGVIVDSEPVHYACWCDVLKPYGFELDWDTYARNCIGVSDRKMLERFAADVGPPVTVEALIGEYPRKKEMFRQRIATADVCLPETIELLRSLAGAYKLAVVSSSARSQAPRSARASASQRSRKPVAASSRR